MPSSEITVEWELKNVTDYTKYYFQGLFLGDGLPSTELQPADDLLLLAGNSFINLWKLTDDEGHLFNAVYLLEFGLTKSKQSFLARLLLIRIYRLLGGVLSSLLKYKSVFIGASKVLRLLLWSITGSCK